MKNKNFKSFDYPDHRNYDLVMLYLVGKLFSKLKHIKISALCVHFKGFIAKKLNWKTNSYKKLADSGYC